MKSIKWKNNNFKINFILLGNRKKEKSVNSRKINKPKSSIFNNFYHKKHKKLQVKLKNVL